MILTDGDGEIRAGKGHDTIFLPSRDLGFGYAAGTKIVTDFSVAEDWLGLPKRQCC